MLRRLFLFAFAVLLCGATAALAQPPGGGPRGGRGFRGGPGGGGAFNMNLLQVPEVQQELKITDDQKGQLMELGNAVREELTTEMANLGGFQALQSEEGRKKMEAIGAKITESTKEKMGKILDATQMKRLDELNLQQQGVMAFSRPEIADKLKLTDEQKHKIELMMEDMRPKGNFFQASPEERQKAFAEMREKGEKAKTDIIAMLSSDQKKTYDEMKGAEFKFPENAGFGPRGGGPGGAGPRQNGGGDDANGGRGRRPRRNRDNDDNNNDNQ